MKKIAILQSNYIPWKGYFDLINSVDEFVIFDDMQYTKRDWRNRNRILTPNGLKWLSIPVKVKGKYHQKINETVISEDHWAIKHWQTINQFYIKSEYFFSYKDIFESFYKGCDDLYLSQVNFKLIKIICEILDIQTKITWSSDYELLDGKTEKLIGICKQSESNIYLSGPSAKSYFDEPLANKNGIKVEWMNYGGYPKYKQLFEPFVDGVTILDLIFNQGPNAKEFMKSFSQ